MTIAYHHRPRLRESISQQLEELRKDAIERGQVDEVLSYARALDAILQAGNYDTRQP